MFCDFFLLCTLREFSPDSWTLLDSRGPDHRQWQCPECCRRPDTDVCSILLPQHQLSLRTGSYPGVLAEVRLEL